MPNERESQGNSYRTMIARLVMAKAVLIAVVVGIILLVRQLSA